ncbi:MAG: hypothetical protein HFF36_06345 [Coprobacillus sp.]|nr:hypothetical protein [Coprobacillus sp.]
MKKIVLTIIICLFLVGCSWNKQPELSHMIEFSDNTLIPYSQKIDSSELIVSVDNISINKNNIDGNKLYVSNFYVICPKIPNKLGKHHLTYEIGKEKYHLDIEVQDLEPPDIQLKKTVYVLEEGKKLELSKIQYLVTDNYSKKDKIKIELQGKENQYILKATDENGNSSFKEINIQYKKIETKSIQKKNYEKTENKKKKSGTIKPVSKQFTVETFKSLKECEKKCIDYIEKCHYSGTAKAVPIMKDGIYIGYKAVFN